MTATELGFGVLDVVPEPYAATPNLLFKLRVTEASGQTVHAIALRCQLRIEAQRRRYGPAEEPGLADLFGPPERWGTTVKPLLWTHVSTMVRGFTGSLDFELPVQCSYDLEVVATKYLHALADGDIPVVLLFSGTVFTRGGAGFGVEQVPWHLEARHQLPVRVWRDLMDLYYPNSGWLRLQRETLDALVRFKATRSLPTWEETFQTLLAATEARA
jgi:hypothetical protein